MDDNRVHILKGVSSADGTTPTAIQVNPVTGAVLAEAVDESVSATVGTALKRDENHISVGAGVSSADSVTPVPFHATAGGKLLVNHA